MGNVTTEQGTEQETEQLHLVRDQVAPDGAQPARAAAAEKGEGSLLPETVARAANDGLGAHNDDSRLLPPVEETGACRPPSDLFLVSAERRPAPFTWHRFGDRLPERPAGEKAKRTRELGLEQASRRTAWLFRAAKGDDRLQLSGAILDGFARPDRADDRMAALRAVRETLAELPLETRRAFRAFQQHGSLADVADELGLAEGEVAARIETAADMVTCALGEAEVSEGDRG